MSGRRFGRARPVYVLISPRTFSAAEACAYDLQALKRVTIVGETSGGGANPGGQALLPDGMAVFVPTGHVSNAITHTNWEGVGVKPDIAVAAADALGGALAAISAVKRGRLEYDVRLRPNRDDVVTEWRRLPPEHPAARRTAWNGALRA